MESSCKSRSRKRKAEDEDCVHVNAMCILHTERSNCEHFTFLSELPNPEDRLKTIQEIRDLRLLKPEDSNQRMQHICDQIPLYIDIEHGYHRDCYQYFTKNSSRLKYIEPLAGTSPASKLKHRRVSTDNKVLFEKDCIFCNKKEDMNVKRGGTWTKESTQKFKSDAWKTVLDCAEMTHDDILLLRIRDCDLFASEAHFHQSCRKKYLKDHKSQTSVNSEAMLYQENLEETHKKAFAKVCKRVSDEIIQETKVLRLTDLLSTYVNALEVTAFANQNYRSEKLKTKLETRFEKDIAFCKLDSKGQFASLLVYSSKMKLETAIKSVYTLENNDMLKESALFLRKTINDEFEMSEELRWPPTVDNIDSTDCIPEVLDSFLKFVFSGKVEETSTQTDRLVSSVGQDICRAVTNGEWKLPKHILLSMTLRHMYRSKQLTTLLNRLGHCESHAFAIELETAIANALEETSSILTSQIIREPQVPSLFHSEFDNFDQLVNTLRGTDSIHTAHGIMMQEVIVGDTEEHGGTLPEIPAAHRTKDRSLNVLVKEELPHCYVGQRKSPSYKVSQRVYPGCEGSVESSNDKNTLWVLLRRDKSSSGQEVAGWTGFLSVTGIKPTKLTTIDYYPVINNPITEYRTVQECLRHAEEATREVGQTYTVTSFDLGVCMKAYPIIWNNHEKYKNHIVMIGTFHLICAYLKMLGKKMAGSGLSDILLEAGLIGTGSIQGVLTGKHYERAMHCHKIMLESLERSLIEQFLIFDGTTNVFDGLPELSKEKLQTLTEYPSDETLEEVVNDEHISAYIKKYCEFKQKGRIGDLGKTTMFWLSYMDHVLLVLSLLRAVKTNDFMLYAECLYKMSDIFFSFDGQNYARYLTYYSVFIANLEESHPGATELLKRGAMSVSRSFIPGNRCAVDKTMEETFMKHAKSHSGTGGSGAGITGIAGNYNSYQRWVRTSHERAKYVEATFSMADMLGDSGSGKRHAELRPSEIQKGDKEVCETVDAIKGFIDPFDVDDKDKLYCISSGTVVPASHENDILLAEQKGKIAKETFISERLEKHDKLFEPIKRMNLKTMEDMGKKVKVKSSKNKEMQYRQQGNIAMQLLVQSQKPEINIDLADLMKYPLTPVPFSIGTADGCLAKTDKSKGLKYVTEGIELTNITLTDKTLLVIEDGNALFHSMREIPSNFRQISEKLFNMMPQRADVIFSTDMYKEDSVKRMERARRVNGERLLIQGENTKKPAEWKSFLTNDDNKKQLVQVMQKSWSNDIYAKKLEGRESILICEGNGYHYTSSDGKTTESTDIRELNSTQEETDTRVVLYILYAKDKGYNTVQVRTPDSDIFFILLHYMDKFNGIKVLFDTGVGNNRKIINMTDLASGYTQEYRTALLGLHAYCGCDTTSAFKGKGHIGPINTMERRPRYVITFAQIGNSWEVSDNLIAELEVFTCAMYGNYRLSSVDELRLCKIREKCEDKQTNALRNIDMATLPPCRRCLIQHIKRTNYQVAIWQNAHIADPHIPPPSEIHGWTDQDGVLEPLWIEGDILPPRMVDILEESINSVEAEEDDVYDFLDELYDD